jgi:NhaP-type Na+/H+ or K+/H+ antiporter
MEAKMKRRARKVLEPLIVLLVLLLLYIAFIEAENSSGKRADESAKKPYDPLYFPFVALVLGALTKSMLKQSSMPYTVVLLLIGILLGGLNFFLDLGQLGASLDRWSAINSDLLLAIFLPALVFYSSFALDTHSFSKSISQALILAGPGVIIGASLIALCARFVFPYGWSWPLSFTFGSLLTAIDPVAVVALMDEAGGPGWLIAVIEGESMINDGTAIVLFKFFRNILELGPGERYTVGEVVTFFIREPIVGPLIGWVVAEAIYFWLSLTRNDAMVDISITIFASYLVYMLAHFQAQSSGVLGVVTLGACLSQRTKAIIAGSIAHNLEAVWSLVSYIANTLVFILSGDIIARKLLENRKQIRSTDLLYGILLYILLLVIRFIANALLFPVLKRTGYGIDWSSYIIMSWGGLRGAVGLALALALDEAAGDSEDAALSSRDGALAVLHTGIVVILTLVLNATTIRWLLQRLGIVKQTSDSKRAVVSARREVRARVLSEYEEKHHVDDTLGSPDFSSLSSYITSLQHSNMETQYDELDDRGGAADTNGTAEEKSFDKQIMDARIRWLNALKTVYWERIDDEVEHTPPAVIHALVEATNVSIDAVRQGEPLTDWAAVLQEFRYSRKVNARPTFFSRVERLITPLLPPNFLWRRGSMRLFLLAAKNFICAHQEVREAAHQASMLDRNAHVYDRVLQESTDSISKAQAALREARINFPEAARAVKAEDVAYHLLSAEGSKVAELQRTGLLDEMEYSMVIRTCDDSLKRLRARPPVPEKYSSEAILRSIKLLDPEQGGLSGNLLEAVLNDVLNGSSRSVRSLQPGDTLTQVGNPMRHVWLLGRGVVKMKGERKDWRRIGTVSHPYGWVVGASQALIDGQSEEYKLHHLTVEAVSEVSAFSVPLETMQKIKREAPEASAMLLRTTAGLLVETRLADDLPKMRKTAMRTAINEAKVIELDSGDVLHPWADLEGSELIVLLEGKVMSHTRGTYNAPSVLAPRKSATSLPALVMPVSRRKAAQGSPSAGQAQAQSGGLAASDERVEVGKDDDLTDFFAVDRSILVRASLKTRGNVAGSASTGSGRDGERGPEAV